MKHCLLSLLFFLSVKIVLLLLVTSDTTSQAFGPFYHSTDFEVHRNWLSITSINTTFDHLTNFSQLEGYSTSSELLCSEQRTPAWLTVLLKARFWYREDSSIWTLDYPPLFAYYEVMMSYLAVSPRSPLVSSGVLEAGVFQNASDRAQALSLQTSGQPYASPGIVRFQRWSVLIFSDIPLFFGVYLLVASVTKPATIGSTLLWVILHPALLVVDNIHFQYNGILFAALSLSLWFCLRGYPTLSAFVFFGLICTKHLFLYYALGYGLWGLHTILWNGKETRSILGAGWQTLKFIAVLLLSIAVAVGPLVLSESIYQLHSTGSDSFTQEGYVAVVANRESTSGYNSCYTTGHLVHDIVSVAANVNVATREALTPLLQRMFPFGRGLCHAYWASNIYPLYNVADRSLCVLGKVLKRDHLPAFSQCGNTSVNTKGLVGLSEEDAAMMQRLPTHAVLPNITPLGSNLLVILTACVMFTMWHRRHRHELKSSGYLLASGCAISSASFFLASWHVHEKAIITVFVPFAVKHMLEPRRSKQRDADLHFMGTLAAVSVFPLLFSRNECITKYVLLCMWVLVGKCGAVPWGWLRLLITLAFVGTSIAVDVVGPQLFLPLMVHSFVGSIGLISVFVRLL